MPAVLTDKQAKVPKAKTTPGEDKNFWTVSLVPPKGASPGLVAFIALGEAAIQSAVNLLGVGTTSPPPYVDDLVQPVQYQNLGKSATSEDYKEMLAMVEARQSALLRADKDVVDVSKYVSDEDDLTLAKIKHIVTDLKTTKLAGPHLVRDSDGNLTNAAEMKVLQHIAEAIEAVYDKVTVVATENAKVAGADSRAPGSASGGTATGNGSGGGSGGDGLAGLLPILAMLPMAAIPLVTTLAPELIDRLHGEEKSSDKDAPRDSSGDGKPEKADEKPGDDDKAEPGQASQQAARPTILPLLPEDLASHIGLSDPTRRSNPAT